MNKLVVVSVSILVLVVGYAAIAAVVWFFGLHLLVITSLTVAGLVVRSAMTHKNCHVSGGISLEENVKGFEPPMETVVMPTLAEEKRMLLQFSSTYKQIQRRDKSSYSIIDKRAN
jgi:hypothetical protein